LESTKYDSSPPSGSLIDLPTYSQKVESVLQENKVVEEFDAFIEETAFHILG
jgi:hypothetical protein